MHHYAPDFIENYSLIEFLNCDCDKLTYALIILI